MSELLKYRMTNVLLWWLSKNFCFVASNNRKSKVTVLMMCRF